MSAPFSFQSAGIDILHPLTELSSTTWVDCRDSPCINQNVQSVLLSDSFYTKGRSDGKETAWKFYIPTKSWSPIPSPPGVVANDYALAVYRSQLVWIGGRVDTGNEQESNRKIFIYEQGKGWKEDTKLVPSIPDDISFYWNLFASGNDKYLIVHVAHKSKLLVFDGKQWQQKDGPGCDMRSILVHHGTLYFIIQTDQGDFFCKASMQSLLAGGNDSDWEMQKLPHVHEYSSLTLVGDHIAMVASIGTISRTLCVLGFSSASDSWIGLTQLIVNHRHFNILSVVGQPNGTLLLMVMMERIQVKDPSLPQNSSAVVLKQFSMLTHQPVLRFQFGMVEVAPNGMLTISAKN